MVKGSVGQMTFIYPYGPLNKQKMEYFSLIFSGYPDGVEQCVLPPSGAEWM